MDRIPITRPYFGQEEERAVCGVLKSGWLVQGEQVKEFEKRVAEHENVKYCCATTSCTTALQLAMLAEGMGMGMDVLVPSFTFVATANAVISTGAIPIMMDIEERTFNLDIAWTENYINKNYSKKTSHGKESVWYNKRTGNQLWGIVVVHQFGLCADMEAVRRVAENYKIHIIEDAACALGAKIGETHIGGFGNTACVSFHPRKSITTGEGGMILTNDLEIYERVSELRNHGSSVASDKRHNTNGYLLPSYTINGYNYRMTDIQGVLGCEQMNKLDYILDYRQEIAACYKELFKGTENYIQIPYVPEAYTHTYQSYVCKIVKRGSLEQEGIKRNWIMEQMEKRGIMTRQGTHAVHKLDYYRKRFGFKDEQLLIANESDLLTISLPVYVGLTKEQQKRVVDTLVELAKDEKEH